MFEKFKAWAKAFLSTQVGKTVQHAVEAGLATTAGMLITDYFSHSLTFNDFTLAVSAGISAILMALHVGNQYRVKNKKANA
jgi:uncharacterized membrane protein YjjP (DUF1212 family)